MRYLVTFFLRNGIHSRRTWWLALLGLLPVGCAMLLWMAKPLLEEEGVTVFGLFPDVGLLLFLNILLPLMAVFVGTAVIADEVEERTLSYLITRPRPRGTIVLAKLAAGYITLDSVMAVSLFLTFMVLVLEETPSEEVGLLSSSPHPARPHITTSIAIITRQTGFLTDIRSSSLKSFRPGSIHEGSTPAYRRT